MYLGRFIRAPDTGLLTLSVKFTEQDKFVQAIHQVSKEMFLRLRHPAPSFARIVLHSIGDTEDTMGFPDYSNAAMYMEVSNSPVEERWRKEILAAYDWTVWFSFFKKGEPREMFKFFIDKTTDLVKDRDLLVL